MRPVPLAPLLLAACWPNVPAPPVVAELQPETAPLVPPRARHFGVVEGRVIDAQTRQRVRLASVVGGGPCIQAADAPYTETDEDGRYSFDLPEGSCGLSVTYRFAVVIREDIDVKRNDVTTVDFSLDHNAVAPMTANFTRSCPGSSIEIDENAGASQADVDGIATAVLGRYAAYANTMADGLPSSEPAFVLMDVWSPHVVLSDSVLPRSGGREFIPKRVVDFRAELKKKKRRDRAHFVEISSVHSDGNCAIVTSGRVSPGASGTLYTDVYERHGNEWRFVRRIGGSYLD